MFLFGLGCLCEIRKQKHLCSVKIESKISFIQLRSFQITLLMIVLLIKQTNVMADQVSFSRQSSATETVGISFVILPKAIPKQSSEISFNPKVSAISNQMICTSSFAGNPYRLAVRGSGADESFLLVDERELKLEYSVSIENPSGKHQLNPKQYSKIYQNSGPTLYSNCDLLSAKRLKIKLHQPSLMTVNSNFNGVLNVILVSE